VKSVRTPESRELREQAVALVNSLDDDPDWALKGNSLGTIMTRNLAISMEREADRLDRKVAETEWMDEAEL
jgi:hypothetical protein